MSVLPSVSKILERIMKKQLLSYINQFLSRSLCGYRKGYNTQTALLSLIEKWKSILDRSGFAGAVLMDLSKAFDTINHELLVAKLHTYGFDKILCELYLVILLTVGSVLRLLINSKFLDRIISGCTSRICVRPYTV